MSVQSIKLFFSAFLFAIVLGSCSQKTFQFTAIESSPNPDYSSLDSWASHPDKIDPADAIPNELPTIDQSDLPIDIFFIHPTTYTGKVLNGSWTAPIDNEDLNDVTDESTIKFQASIFNAAGKVYAPRYRQAHIESFYSTEKLKSSQALSMAYSDVKAAFEYYLSNNNHNRPFIIASHSQGTFHAARLIKELIDGKGLQKKMIAAYLVGMPIRHNTFNSITPCIQAEDTNCYVSWRTSKRNFIPELYPTDPEIVVHNPLNWKMNDEYVDASQNKGIVLRNFNKVFTHRVDAQIHESMLWVNKPKFPWSFLFMRKNYHIADFNFFYVNVRDNAVIRRDNFLANDISKL